MEEWKEYKLGDVCTIVGRIGFRGYTTDDLTNNPKDGAITLSPTNIVAGELDLSKPTYIKWPKYYESPEIMLEKDDIVIVKTGSSIGRTTRIREIKHPMTLNPQFVVLKDIKVDNGFLSYIIKSPLFQASLKAITVGSAIPTLSQKNLAKISINIPEEKTQKRISRVLSSLDDKIEVNRKINANLEQQAQALFKSWFVDFEPFKNGEFVESELGMIPKGWRVGRFDDIIESTISGDWGKEKPERNYIHKVACIRGCDFQDIKNGLRGKTPERYILEKNFQTKHFKDKDILVEISGGTATVSTGRVCPVSQLLIDKFNEDIVCTNFCRLVRPVRNYGAYLYYSWLFKYNNKVMFGYENGTSGIKNFRIKDFTALEPVVIPSEEALLSFQSMIDRLQMKLQMNGSESQKLATLRDTLLPKLMSGELKVNEVEI